MSNKLTSILKSVLGLSQAKSNVNALNNIIEESTPSHWLTLATSHIAASNWGAALSAYNRLLVIQRDDWKAWLTTAVLHSRLGNRIECSTAVVKAEVFKADVRDKEFKTAIKPEDWENIYLILDPNIDDIGVDFFEIETWEDCYWRAPYDVFLTRLGELNNNNQHLFSSLVGFGLAALYADKKDDTFFELYHFLQAYKEFTRTKVISFEDSPPVDPNPLFPLSDDYSFELYHLLGRLLYRTGDYELGNGAWAFAYASKLNNKSALSSYGEGLAHYRDGNYTRTIACFNKAVQSDESFLTDLGLLMMRGRAKISGELVTREAVAQVAFPSVLSPESEDLLQRDSPLLDAEGAIQDFDRVITIDSSHLTAVYNRGVVKHFHLAKYQEALADYDKALSLAVDTHKHESLLIGLRNYRGMLKMNLLDYNGAIIEFRHAIALYGNDFLFNRKYPDPKPLAEFYYQMAKCYLGLNNIKMARECIYAIENGEDWQFPHLMNARVRELLAQLE